MGKAYEDLDFLHSRDARTLRILAEYLEPQARFAHYSVTDTVVFSRYYEDARTLARLLTEWSKGLRQPSRRFLVCSGGGPGIMEAANRGASEAAGISVGLGISLPMEATANRYITRELGFEFHYFFMRKFWFVYLAKALVVFPGGFGTLDELFELLTLTQTRKIGKRMPVVLYGRAFWDEVVDFDALVRWGTIAPEDLGLFHVCDSPGEAFGYLESELTRLYLEPASGPGTE
jgi:uncharacterized protein (TIGR00730 family)